MSESINADLARVRKHAEELGEHFDGVQIFCSRHEAGTEDGTIHVTYGGGNWFARYGQIREWLIQKDEQTREKVRSESKE